MDIKIKLGMKPPELNLAAATLTKALAAERRKGFELHWKVEGTGEVTQPLPPEIDPDGEVGQQLSALLGKNIANGITLADFGGQSAFLLLTARRTSGGKFAHSVAAILTPELIEDAAEKIGSIRRSQAT